MTGCTIIRVDKACSGKCKSSPCAGDGRIWLAAACSGMTALYRKQTDGRILPASANPTQAAVFSSIEDFRSAVARALDTHVLNQLVIVGAENDIAWVHAALPPELAKYVAAEIKYPLLPAWFGGDAPRTLLPQALQHAMA